MEICKDGEIYRIDKERGIQFSCKCGKVTLALGENLVFPYYRSLDTQGKEQYERVRRWFACPDCGRSYRFSESAMTLELK